MKNYCIFNSFLKASCLSPDPHTFTLIYFVANQVYYDHFFYEVRQEQRTVLVAYQGTINHT